MKSLFKNKKIEEALQFVTQRGWQQKTEFFPGLVRMLASTLSAEYAFVTSVANPNSKIAKTVIVLHQDEIVENIQYSLVGTPCEHVFGEKICVYPEGVQSQFPRDTLLADINAESYIGIPLWNPQGVPIGLIGVISSHPLQDIDLPKTVLQIVALRVASELEYQAHEKELMQREEKFRNLFEKATDAIYLIDPLTARFIDANQMASSMLGYTKTQFQSMSVTDIDQNIPSSEAISWCNKFTEKSHPTHFERKHVTKGGAYIPVEVKTNPIRIGGKQLIQAHVRDLSPRKQLEEQLLQSQKMQAIGTLAGGIAHDFNNILMSISGFAELALAECSDPKVNDKLQNIFESSQRAYKLVSQILTFSRKAPQKTEAIALVDVINVSVSMLSASFPPPVTIKVNIKNKEVYVSGDITQLEQAIMNICTNAVHALKNQQGVVSLELDKITLSKSKALSLGGLDEGEYAYLTVHDTGTGMSKDIIKRIFEPFFTTKEQGKGTGLGLAMAHGIIKSHHGTITVNSEIDQGSVFSIWLPLSSKPSSEISAEKHSIETSNGKGRILLIDDEPQVLRILKTVLSEFGYQPNAFSDPVEALEAFCKEPDSYIAIITDEAMPVMRGSEVITKAKAVKKEIPVFLCTGYLDSSIIEQNNQQVYFLQKPFLLSKLSEMLAKHLPQTEPSEEMADML